jgi:hypothetical protein
VSRTLQSSRLATNQLKGNKWSKREPSPETWGEWGTAIGNYWAHRYASPDDVPGLPHYKRSPEPETWAEWGKNVGQYWANRYNSPDDVPGLRHYRREPEPEPFSVTDILDELFGNSLHRREPETWGEWGSAIGHYYANKYGSPDNVLGLPHYKREPEPEPFSIGDLGSDFGNLFGDFYVS